MRTHLLEVAIRDLAQLPVRAAPETVFDVIGRFAPVVGGLVGVTSTGDPESTVSHAVRLPISLVEGWASAPKHHFRHMMDLLFRAPAGSLINDRKAVTGKFRKELELIERVRAERLGESAGYRVSTRPTAGGGMELSFITLALDGKKLFTPAQAEDLALLQPAIRAALDRMRVPLIPSEPILAQIVAEQSIGFMCLAKGGVIIEANQRMHTFVERYGEAAGVTLGRHALSEFAQRAVLETRGRPSWPLSCDEGRIWAEVTTHHLAYEAHAISQPLVLVMLREQMLRAPPPRPRILDLGPRQGKIASLLIDTGMSYKEIAAHLRIGPGTVRSHVEDIYRRLDVHSRAELTSRYK